VIAFISHIESAIRCHRNVIDSIELSISIALTAPRVQEIAYTTEALNAVVASI
jgi:hypothetical protein